ncbi:MAG: crossover junction endodeoxyribonuclease RuvC [Candidatus Taylorbacteria bacterium CG11_big_fil_rev_8_21_14_0_20_46_11]|uniref:Crossover junction endodeoxyribonuclease RuvC n=1 Tax=Candidatus Taylorbacteria bacterium CG11_big_fil_rev_8_21_14_0_20_46_11 TaxID=1975025 RepID=A0A2H0KBX0_9BACT|nr:MAG: crossover junction endodeoxyribonuclease RuvC [Candidatus Taylorbacteria bacterium CG11_big_fil_rev_8_21_14_0_20_46_11]
MRILAIDPGYERLGVAILEKLPRQKETVVYSACIRTKKTTPHAYRLLEISEAVIKVIEKFKPEALAIETLFLHSNQKTVMAVSEARGAILVSASKMGLTIHEYTPLQIKIAVTGYGRGDKTQIISMVQKLISLPLGKRLDDEYDAIAVGLTCFASTKRNMEHKT